jgi:hypothetical protein
MPDEFGIALFAQSRHQQLGRSDRHILLVRGIADAQANLRLRGQLRRGDPAGQHKLRRRLQHLVTRLQRQGGDLRCQNRAESLTLFGNLRRRRPGNLARQIPVLRHGLEPDSKASQ